MSVYRFKVASGDINEIKFLEVALKSMFMFEFSVDQVKKDEAELIARSYTEDEVSDIRKPKLIKVASELKKDFELSVDIEGYDASMARQNLEVERFGTYTDAVFECNLDKYYFDIVYGGMDKPNFEMQYRFIYGKTPTKEQLEVFKDFMNGRTTMEHVVKLCGKDAEENQQAGPSNN